MATGGMCLKAHAYASRPYTALPTTFPVAFYNSTMVGSDRLRYSAPLQAAAASSAAAGATGELYNDLQMSRVAVHQQLLGHMELSATSISIMWLAPCYFVLGAAEVFTNIGLLEFFYDQSPGSMKSLGVALAQIAVTGGNYLSSALLAVASVAGWIPGNLDEDHLDYFFWFVTTLSALNLLQFVYCSIR